MTAVVVVAFLALMLGVPTWLGLRNARYMTDGLTRPHRCGHWWQRHTTRDGAQ